ncbi:HNH endonuclease [Hymenobacter sp. M29]|uniref:HNH endonuclease n=1 Tax=Hymenobacter mellowenesis TaxID=3063995 RepID=A0ABT9AIK0_9BACT|nr:HNH endonuclease [Hymenobacter sp. M29]MDO7849688.1 HNH endonuclease [Hymenobacter sp. M29]
MPDNKWRSEEVEIAVEAYMALFEQIKGGGSDIKQPVFRELSHRHGRSVAAFNYRFRNISYVLSRMGLPTLPNFSFISYTGGTDETVIKQIIEARGYFSDTKPTADLKHKERSMRELPALGILNAPVGKQRPTRITATVESFVRDSSVKAWVLMVADGHCENCGQPAPFVQEDGTPFLEVHHVKPLADGGSDTVTNAVAICPNCHRRFHYGADAIQLALRIVERLERLRAE